MHNSKSKLTFIAIVVVCGLLAALPNILSSQQLERLPSWLPQVTLGLDVKGGSQLTLEVDQAALIHTQLRSTLKDAEAALGEASIEIISSSIGDSMALIDFAGAHDDVIDVIKDALEPENFDAFGTAQASFKVEAVEGAVIQIELTEAGLRERMNTAIAQSLEVVRLRVDEIGIAEPTIQRLGTDRLLVQLPGLENPSQLRDLLGQTAQISFHLLDINAARDETAPPNVDWLPAADGTTDYPIVLPAEIKGEHLKVARPGFDWETGEPIVSFRFDMTGAYKFARLTQKHVDEPFAIVMDGKVLSAPVIQEPITGGLGQISGRFSIEETTTLAALMRAGSLPVELSVVEEHTVGPDFGRESIERGTITGIVGFALVFCFMIALYGGWGLIANAALFINVVLTFAALGLLGATLTLPGIAGLILTIGLAVDANVLINERIREESKKSKSAFATLDNGFRRAYATILDSNATALIATALLFFFGSGSVRGFAVTMALGICMSLFTAVFVVRVAMIEIIRRRNLKTLSLVSPLVNWRDNSGLRVMKMRTAALIASLMFFVTSAALLLSPGLNFGVDFLGGIQMELKANEPVDLSGLRSRIADLDLGDVTLQELDGGETISLRAEQQPASDVTQVQASEDIKDAVVNFDPPIEVGRTDVIGPKVSGEMAASGSVAVALAGGGMFGYIWRRFEKAFAVGAIATLVLDVVLTAGFFAVSLINFDLGAIAALLTLIGYSVNDKIVIYDRIRENKRLFRSMPFADLIDKSINQSLARSIYTSVTTLLVMLPMAIWGGNAVASFAVPMTFGIVVATLTSIFVAGPLLFWWGSCTQNFVNDRRP